MQDDYECVVKMIGCPCWPSAFNPLSSVFELVNKVKAWQAEHEQTQGPVVVVDRLVHFLPAKVPDFIWFLELSLF